MNRENTALRFFDIIQDFKTESLYAVSTDPRLEMITREYIQGVNLGDGFTEEYAHLCADLAEKHGLNPDDMQQVLRECIERIHEDSGIIGGAQDV